MKAKLAVPVVLLSLALAGCGQSGRAGPVAPGSNAGPSSPVTQPSDSPPPPPTVAAQAPPPKFGQTWTWPDGLSVTVTPPTKFAPSGTAAGVQGKSAAVVFTVTLVNHTDRSFDPEGLFTSMQAGQAEGSRIFDSGNTVLGVDPRTPVLPGRQVVFRQAYAVDVVTDLVVAVESGGGRDQVLFTN